MRVNGRSAGALLAVVALGASGLVVGLPAQAAPAHVAPAQTAAAPAASLPAVRPSAAYSTVPARVRGLGTARQLIVVTNPRRTSYTTLTAYEKDALGWRVVAGPLTSRIGLNGFARPGARRQGTLTSPTGVFALGPSFGNGSSPGTRMPYRVVDGNDKWVYDRQHPSTYNTFQPSKWGSWRGIYQENLAQLGAQYRYVVSIGYNRPVMSMSPTVRPRAAAGVDIRAGGGIFLHVNGTKMGGATAGCVSVPRASMRGLLRWLDPAKRPVMAMGRAGDILRPLSGTMPYRAAGQAVPALGSARATAVATQTIGTSRGGRPITATVLGPADAPRRMVVIGVIHGNERAGRRVTDALRRLPLPAGLRVWLVPTFNADGWADYSRTNAARVDLNRNFPRAWRYAGRGGPNYSGPRAASEPETRAMMSMLDRVDPGLVAIFHQPLYGVDSYGAKSMRTVRALSARMRLPVRSFDCKGGCHGTLTQWFNRSHRGQAITVEFGSGRPSQSSILRAARALLAVAPSSLVAATG